MLSIILQPIKKYISLNKYLWNTYYVLDIAVGFGGYVSGWKREKKNPCPLGACIYQKEKVNKIHMQNGSNCGDNLVIAMAKNKAGKTKGGQRRFHDAFTPHYADFSRLSPTMENSCP